MMMVMMVMCVNGDSAPSHYFNVLDFGAKADHASDNTAAFASAIANASASNGGVVFAPPVRHKSFIDQCQLVRRDITSKHRDSTCSMDILRSHQGLH